MDNKILFVLYHMDFHLVVNQHPHLSLSLYKQYSIVTKYKAYFYRVYIQAHKDTKKKWHALPYLVTEDDMLALVQKFPAKWMTTLGAKAGDSATEQEEDTS